MGCQKRGPVAYRQWFRRIMDLGLYAKGYSLAQNEDRLVFNRKGKLSDEFERLFASIFTNPDDAIKVIMVLSEKSIGYNREELLSKTGVADGGGFAKLLKWLQESDFRECMFRTCMAD